MSTSVPGPAEVSPDLALSSALRWIDRPRDSSAWLWFGGKERAGKTGVLREIAGRHPDSVFLDCAGMPSEEIARKLAASFGVAAPDTYGRNFAEAVTKITTGPVVILANTQWAGNLRTTREPERAVHQVVRTLIRNHRRSVRMRLLIEVEHTADMVASLRGRELTLRGPDENDAQPTDSMNQTEAAAFRALALAESRTVPLTVWSILCSALGHDFSVQQLEELVSSYSPDTLTRTDSEFTWPAAAFRRESTAQAWRGTLPPEEAQRFHLQALSTLRSVDPVSAAVRWYVHRSAAGHAAAAGAFESLLEDAPTMAQVSHHSLFEAFEAAYHDHSVPSASLAAGLYYLAERGVWPSTHGEWLALLHHTLLNRGPSGETLADQLLTAADSSTWPWHTMWAHGAGPGIATTEHLIRRPTARTLRLGQTDSDSLAIATDDQGNSNIWRLGTGEPAADQADAPAVPESFTADQGLHGWRPAGAADGHVDLPRMPRYVRRAVRAGDLAVMSSSDGVFAIRIHSSEPKAAQPEVLKRMLRTDTRVATADFPAEALHANAEWFESVWGPSLLKRVAEDSLPASLADADARRFLTEIGFPYARGFLELETVDLSATGLTAISDSPIGQGTGFRLGTWQGAQLLLDGASGKVLQDGSSGISDPLAGSSLRQFVTMARLYFWWFASDWPIEDTEADLRSWLARIDPDAYAAQCWQRVFEDYNFADRV
ncbi:SUKH-4 family immunity protein [Streptomyces sp. NPDC002088]|uniref:SUKH-4 family immunity protein n=1 Tax=Streptomyces sp. NPDC002088 TaxID=3154665 RepID=UPI003326FF0A